MKAIKKLLFAVIAFLIVASTVFLIGINNKRAEAMYSGASFVCTGIMNKCYAD